MQHARSEQRRPSVPSAAHRPWVAPKVRARLRQLPGTCLRCILHGGIRVEPGRVVVSPDRPLRNEWLPFIVSRGTDGGLSTAARRASVALYPYPLLRPGGLRCGHHSLKKDLSFDPWLYILDCAIQKLYHRFFFIFKHQGQQLRLWQCRVVSLGHVRAGLTLLAGQQPRILKMEKFGEKSSQCNQPIHSRSYLLIFNLRAQYRES